MYYKEHAPPHVHAEYQGQQGTFSFSGQQLAGNVKSGTALRLIREWATSHRSLPEANWANMEAGRQLDRIEPLE